MIAIIHRHIALWQRRAALGALLHRADDHLLDDIGLCRDDLVQMLASAGPGQPPRGSLRKRHRHAAA